MHTTTLQLRTSTTSSTTSHTSVDNGDQPTTATGSTTLNSSMTWRVAYSRTSSTVAQDRTRQSIIAVAVHHPHSRCSN
eukprot:5382426-Amphidinium_carterae.1